MKGTTNPPTGLRVHVFRNALGDSTNGGRSANVKTVTVVNVDGPFAPTDDAPAFVLVTGPTGVPILRPVDGPTDPEATIGPMAGGNIASTSDSRWTAAVTDIAGTRFAPTGVAIHDRFETPETYRALSI